MSPTQSPISDRVSKRLLSANFSGSARDQFLIHREQYREPTAITKQANFDLISMANQAGLLGRGGAAFPTGKKMLAVAAQKRRAAVVVNATEGEPASSKDKTLLAQSPHLVIDGALWAAAAVGASEVVICVENTSKLAIDSVERAFAARQQAGERAAIRLELTPERFVVGEESALVHWINAKDARPTLKPPAVYEKGMGGMPTLLDNAETLAHLSLIANNGPDWYRSIGTEAEPGTTLLTISGAVDRPGVYEVPFGKPLAELLVEAEADTDPQAVLVGGYFGSWLTPAQARRALVSNASLKELGSALGCGVIVVLPKSACGVRETARVLTWMSGQPAGQCGSCVNGLASIADLTSRVYLGKASDSSLDWLERWAAQIEGRGACRLPDGAVRFMRSALRVFATDIETHKAGRPCAGCNGAPLLPLPKTASAK